MQLRLRQPAFLLLPLLLAAASGAAPDPVTFPSGEEFAPLEDQSPPGYEDPEDTGSLAFARRPENARLAWGVTLDGWCGGCAEMQPFRAHPALIGCLADMNSDLQRQSGQRLLLKRGYLALKDAGSPKPTFPLNYHAAGAAAELGLRSGAADASAVVTGPQRGLSAAFARACASRLTAAGWDFGLVAGPTAGSLTVLLQSQRRPAALDFRVLDASEFADVAELEAWTRRHWQLGFLAGVNATAELAVCEGFGNVPDDQANPETAVGPADELTTPPDSPDYLRLMQYPAAGQLDFPGCPKLLGSWRDVKCPARLMSARMYDSVRRLHAIIQHHRPGWQLRVEASWEAPEGGRPSLRSEGRQLELVPTGDNIGSSADAARQVANMARCAGFDYVHVDATVSPARVRLAVVKQKSASAKPVIFQQIGHLTPVEPPSQLANQYLVTGIDSLVLEDRPLFDGALDPATPLGTHARMGMFVSRSKEFRYFRLHPALTACYDALVEQANSQQRQLHLRDGGDPDRDRVGVSVVRGYLTEFEERALLEPTSDPRVGGHPEGLAMQLTFDPASPGYRPERHTVWRLAESAAAVCAPRFHEHRSLFGIGVYNDSVYVDIRPIAKVWMECEPETSVFTICHLSPPPAVLDRASGGSLQSAFVDFKTYLLEKALQAIQGRVVDPLAGDANCEFDRPPQEQSADFVYRPKKQRPLPEEADMPKASIAAAKAAPSSSSSCQSGNAESEFCRKSAATRATLVGHLWSDLSTKHQPAGSDRVRRALEDCLLACDSSGCATENTAAWQRKLAACESLAHWLPFQLENDLPGRLSNLYAPGDAELRRLACYSGEHCVDWSPLYSILNPTLTAWFRPKPDGAAKESVYDAEGNPSPLLGVVRRLYAQYARGDVKVWLRDETDVKSALEELKVLFLYNRQVTSVMVMVLDARSVNQVASQLETEFGDWLQQACPANSRDYLTPHRVVSVGRSAAATFARVDASSADAADAVRRGLHPPLDSVDLRHW